MTAKSPNYPRLLLPLRINSDWFAKAKASSWQLLTLPLLLFIALPILAIFLRTSLADLLANLNETQVVRAVNLSLLTSVITTVVTWITGTPVAYLLAQRRFRLNIR